MTTQENKIEISPEDIQAVHPLSETNTEKKVLFTLHSDASQIDGSKIVFYEDGSWNVFAEQDRTNSVDAPSEYRVSMLEDMQQRIYSLQGAKEKDIDDPLRLQIQIDRFEKLLDPVVPAGVPAPGGYSPWGNQPMTGSPYRGYGNQSRDWDGGFPNYSSPRFELSEVLANRIPGMNLLEQNITNLYQVRILTQANPGFARMLTRSAVYEAAVSDGQQMHDCLVVRMEERMHARRPRLSDLIEQYASLTKMAARRNYSAIALQIHYPISSEEIRQINPDHPLSATLGLSATVLAMIDRITFVATDEAGRKYTIRQ